MMTGRAVIATARPFFFFAIELEKSLGNALGACGLPRRGRDAL
jgi:hypothetical protein